ncbi:MAG: hypothetical protein SGI72_17020 [Planctomycetota bacterium]|nr:hypothetical protein [Planctomycetota bacterium]
MRVEMRLILSLFCVFVLATLAHAVGDKEVTVGNDVVVRMRWPWPDMLNHGAQPIFVEVANRGGEERTLDLSLSMNAGMESCTIGRQMRLGAGEETAFEVCAPVHSFGASPYMARLTCGTETEFIQGVGASLPAEHGVRNVLIVSAAPLDPGMPATWAKSLSIDAPTSWGIPPPVDPTDPADFYRRRVRSMSTPSPTTMDLVAVTPILFADLPRNSACYSSVDAVVIDTNGGLPSVDALAAIAAFARAGGVVVFGGSSARESVRSAPEFAAWNEPRFLVGDKGTSRDAYLCGQGLLVVEPRDIWSLEYFDRTIVSLLGSQNGDLSLVPRVGGGRGTDLVVVLPGLELPYRALMGVLFLFAIVIGPVNLWLVKRSKKPVLLLVTVPVIAIVFSLALFAYGALAQGLDVRMKRVTTTLLDQRTHRSTSLQTREIFAGLAVGNGLVPGPGAWVYSNPNTGSWDDRKNFRIRLDDGVEFSGDYLPARTPTRQTTITDRAARQRVDLRRVGDGWSAQFALGADVRRFVFRAPEGKLWRLRDAASDGATARLELAVSNVDVGMVERILAAKARDEAQGLPLGTYAAVLESSPFDDAMGVEARDVDSTHHVVGIVDMAEVNR